MKRRIFTIARASIALLLMLSMLFLLSCSATASREEEETTAAGDAQVSGTPKKRVALTYDDGPHATRTPMIVDELDKYGFHATFFVVGNRVDGSEYNGGDAMLYAIKHGNEVGIHGYTHDMSISFATCSDKVYKSEMSQTKAAIREVKTGYKIKLMRPVGGAISEERIENSPYSVILWDVDSLDWQYKYEENGVETIVNNVLENVRDGSIILMHDIYESTYEATVIILEKLNEMGYEVVTVSELLGDDREAGRAYERGE